MAPDLHVFIDEGRIFMSFHASLLPAVIPPIPQPWNPVLEIDYSSHNIKDTLTTQWAYKLRPWFQNPVFDGAIFGCLNHSYYSLPIEATPNGRYILCQDIREEWQMLEQQLTWCQGHLATSIHFP
jgi:hypothetical protein